MVRDVRDAQDEQERDERIQTFEEFWPYYVRQHSKKTTRHLHFLGTTLAMACAGGALLGGRKSLALLAPLVGYGPAWLSHFFIEGNKPATFDYPLWSLKADLLMWTKMVAGTMDDEVDMAMAEAIVKEAGVDFFSEEAVADVATEETGADVATEAAGADVTTEDGARVSGVHATKSVPTNGAAR